MAGDEDDGQVVRELKPNTAAQHLDKTTYRVKIKTGEVFGAGTDADVYLKIFGKKGDSGKVALRTAKSTGNKFEGGQIDSFDLEFEDLGKVRNDTSRYGNRKFIRATLNRSNTYLLDTMARIRVQDGFSIG